MQGGRLPIQLDIQKQQNELYTKDQSSKPVSHFFETKNRIHKIFYDNYDAILLQAMCIWPPENRN